jgi:hypothetical protein
MSLTVRTGSRVLVVAAAVAALTAAVASGHTKVFKTKKIKGFTTLQYTNQDPAPVPPGGGPPPPTPVDPTDFFSGDLATRTTGPAGEACLNRTVKVLVPSTGVVVGQTTTASDGGWKLSAEDVAANQYMAVAPGKKVAVTIPGVPGVVQGHKHIYLCGKWKSDPIAAGP